MMKRMNDDTLAFLAMLEGAGSGKQWKKTLDVLTTTLRKGFVYDNLALYVAEKEGAIPEAVYARAVGRGRSAEADAAWGEDIANQVISSGTRLQVDPAGSSTERVHNPFLLGLPLSLLFGRGALVFVRFGGPSFEAEQIMLASLAACIVSRVYERKILTSQKNQLEKARHQAQLQDDFIATVSHDLRTPIGFIKGYTTSLLRSDTVWEPETQREFLNIIDEETDHLMELIDRMLDSARLQNGMMRMDFQPTRLDALIRDEVQRIRAHHPDLVVHLDLKPLPVIRADSIRLAQVLDNLFDNAIKYAAGTPIRIATHQQDGSIKVTFADQGPGIPPEHLQFLFERFYRAPGITHHRGTGLGLFICREIIRAHGGSIVVESSSLGQGTVFCIEIPLERPKG